MSLTDLSPSALPAPVAPAWIALGVGDALPPHVLRYAIGACARMQAGLLLLSLDAERTRALLAPYAEELAGVVCRSLELESAAPTAVARSLDRQRGLLFAVSGADSDPVRALLRGRHRTRSPVPIALVDSKAGVP